MSLRVRPYADVTIPSAGSVTGREILSLAIRRLLDDLRQLSPEHAVTAAEREQYVAFRSMLVRLLEVDPGAVASLLRHPTVAVFVRALRQRAPDEQSAGWLSEMVATAALELAAAESLKTPLTLTRFPARVSCLPGRFSLHVPEDVQTLRFESGAVVLGSAAGEVDLQLVDANPRWMKRPYSPLAGGMVLALVDNNPLRMIEAHPDEAGSMISLGGRAVPQWTSALTDALGLVEHLPDLWREMALFIQQIVPVGFDREAHLSASYPEAIGTIYMTLYPQVMTMAEALIHEFSHNKLNALFEVDPLLSNAFEPLFPWPVPPDPRPLHDILLAVHAFLPVARLYERMTEERHPFAATPEFQRRFAEIVHMSHQGAAVLLANAETTEVGRAVLDEIAEWDAHFSQRL